MGNQQPQRFKARTETSTALSDSSPNNLGSTSITELDSLLPSRPTLPSFYTSSPDESNASPDNDINKNNMRDARRHTLMPSSPPSSIRPVLYTSHFTSQWAERSWEFTIILLLTFIGPADRALFLVSSYGLFCALASLLSLGAVGAFIDRANRITAFRLILIWQNLSVIAATASCFALLVMRENETDESDEPLTFDSPFFTEDWTLYLIVSVHVFGASASIASSASSVSIEKDWVPEIAKTYDDPGWLTQTNVTMRQIDLGCKVVAPVFAGFVIEYFKDNLEAACIAMGVFNVLTILCEWICSKQVYGMIPSLHTKQVSTPIGSDKSSGSTDSEGFYVVKEKSSAPAPSGGFFSDTATSLKIFFTSEVALPGFALSLLYVNVMSYGSIMLAYVTWRGLSAPIIGLTRGIASTIGLLGTVAFQFSSKRTGIDFTGFWSIVMQGVLLGVSYYSEFVDDDTESLTMLIAGVCGSRIGLWAFDMSVSQQMQERVPESERGAVGGIQTALCSLFEMLSFVFGLVWSKPEEFKNLITVSYAGQLLAVVCYCAYYCKGGKK